MTRKKKITLTLRFDNPILKVAMENFFRQYQEQLPMYLRDQASQLDKEADPSMLFGFEKDEIVFKMQNKDKGQVFVCGEDSIVTMDYKLVPNETAYVTYESGAFAIFWKRGPLTPDTRIGQFPSLDMMVEGLQQVEDPLKVLENAEAIAAEAKEEVEKEQV
jgi:hypothetical protein